MAESHRAEHFGTLEAQIEAGQLGMWIFLGTEVLLFAALFTGYAFFRVAYPQEFHEASHHMKVVVGTINTYVLITSSVFVALAVYLIRRDRSWASAGCLFVALLLGCVFLGLKFYEYHEHVKEGALPGAWYAIKELPKPGAVMFLTLYWLMTGLHALHMTVAIGVLAVVAFRTAGNEFDHEYHAPVELGGMYWHLVDLIWIFLYPLFYLVTPMK